MGVGCAGAAWGAGLGLNSEDLGALAVSAAAAWAGSLTGGLAVNALAKSAMLTFMLCKVVKVIFCTSIAWMVALSAVVFCSNQNSTDFNSWMRLSMSSMLRVGATQLAMPGMPAAAAGCAAEAVLDRFCKKSKPGTNWPKPKAEGSLMADP